MSASEGELPWHDPAWLEAATTWIDAALGRAGITRDGAVEQPHAVWWSTALRVPTADGPVWFKATNADGAFEPALTALLASRSPDVTAEVIALDAERGWMLTRDAGVRLRDVDEGPSLSRWAELLPRYADLQRELAGRVDELLALGVPDLRLAVLPGLLEEALGEPESLFVGRPDGLASGQHAALLAALPGFREECERLAAFGVPETLQHDDFHDGNVYVRDRGYAFFDWGDACVSHPFHTLVVTLRALAWRYALRPEGPELARLRDAYLEPWADLLPRSDAVAAADLAGRTGTVQRAVAWWRYSHAMPPAVREENAAGVPYGLRLYLMRAPLGAWDDGSF